MFEIYTAENIQPDSVLLAESVYSEMSECLEYTKFMYSAAETHYISLCVHMCFWTLLLSLLLMHLLSSHLFSTLYLIL